MITLKKIIVTFNWELTSEILRDIVIRPKGHRIQDEMAWSLVWFSFIHSLKKWFWVPILCQELLVSLRVPYWLTHKSLSRPCQRQVLLPHGLAGIISSLFSGVAFGLLWVLLSIPQFWCIAGLHNATLRENSTCSHFMPFSDNWESFSIPVFSILNPVIVLSVYFHNLRSLPVARGFLSFSF